MLGPRKSDQLVQTIVGNPFSGNFERFQIWQLDQATWLVNPVAWPHCTVWLPAQHERVTSRIRWLLATSYDVDAQRTFCSIFPVRLANSDKSELRVIHLLLI
jgi:hypothetical protein